MTVLKDRTIVALASIVVIGALVALGHNGALVNILGIIMGFYFGRETGDKEVE